ncbi:hypothetical protein SAMN05660284_01992 [Formivibrio citricus]|uniref:Uncharacterized protein n=1 Tax=Formivibrio citricus TaxID=83765 RepID=A0A1I5AU46_9NEIS|nr:hypothetical protein [Formivibrio citricus]SFN65912.1 hypothetical protein SAMN05660284_01992 [Formivibrio citricus]
MDFDKIFNYIFLVIYVGGLSVFFVVMAKLVIDKRKARHELKQNLLEKFKAAIPLSINDVINMAKGADLARPSVGKCLNQLLSATNDPVTFGELQRLTAELEKEEPFDDLPEEVKPSLVRLTELCDASSVKSDKYLLSPVQKTLGTYVELKAEVEKNRTKAKWLNIAGIVSLIVGTWSFYLTWKSPDVKDIEAAVKRAVSSPSQEPNPAVQGTLRDKAAQRP